MFVSCYNSKRVERFSYLGALIASYAISGNPTGTSQSPFGVFGGAHNGTFFLIGNDGSVRSESVGGHNFMVAYDTAYGTNWMSDIDDGIIYELQF